jgi:hypothetical protein
MFYCWNIVSLCAEVVSKHCSLDEACMEAAAGIDWHLLLYQDMILLGCVHVAVEVCRMGCHCHMFGWLPIGC